MRLRGVIGHIAANHRDNGWSQSSKRPIRGSKRHGAAGIDETAEPILDRDIGIGADNALCGNHLRRQPIGWEIIRVNEHIPVRADPPSIIDRDDFVEMRFLPSLCLRDIGPTAENKKGLHAHCSSCSARYVSS